MEEKSYWFVSYVATGIYYNTTYSSVIEIPGEDFLLKYATNLLKDYFEAPNKISLSVTNFIRVSKKTYDEFKNTPD